MANGECGRSRDNSYRCQSALDYHTGDRGPILWPSWLPPGSAMSGKDKPSDSDGHDEKEPEESNTDERGLKGPLVVAVHIGDFINHAQDLWGWVVSVVTMMF